MGQHSACLSEDDDDNIKASQTSQPTPTSQRTPTPKMTRCTPKPSRPTHSRSRHSQGSTVSATDDAFPDTMQPIKEETEKQLTVYKRPKDDVTEDEADEDEVAEDNDNDNDAESESDQEKHEDTAM